MIILPARRDYPSCEFLYIFEGNYVRNQVGVPYCTAVVQLGQDASLVNGEPDFWGCQMELSVNKAKFQALVHCIIQCQLCTAMLDYVLSKHEQQYEDTE